MALTIKEIAESYTIECLEFIEYMAGGPEHIGMMTYQIDAMKCADFISEVCKICYMHHQSPRMAALVIFSAILEYNKRAATLETIN